MTARLQTEEDMVIDQPLRSTDEGVSGKVREGRQLTGDTLLGAD